MALYQDFLDEREKLIQANLNCYESRKGDKSIRVFDIVLAVILILFWLLAIYILFYSNKGEQLNDTVVLISSLVLIFVPVYFMKPIYKEHMRRKAMANFDAIWPLEPFSSLLLANREAVVGTAVVAFSSLIEKGTITVSSQKVATQELIETMDAILLELQQCKHDMEFKLIQRKHQGSMSMLPAYWKEIKNHPVTGYWYNNYLSDFFEKVYVNHK